VHQGSFHVQPYSYTTTCQEKTVDTTANSSSIYVSAPDATSSMSRPSSTGAGYFSFIVDVSERQSNNSFKEVASSWQARG